MGEQYDRLKKLSDEYMERTVRIRRLSAPSIQEVANAAEYRKSFQENTRQIAELFEENKEALEREILPLLSEEHTLGGEEVRFLKDFADDLQNASELEFKDVSLLWLIAEKLYQDASEGTDIDYLVQQIDLYIIACMGKTSQNLCQCDTDTFWREYHRKGVEVVGKMFPLLEKERFSAIESEETRELLVINSRYFCAVYDVPELDDAERDLVVERLIASYHMAEDPFYTERVPHYDWLRHRIKCLEYMGNVTEQNNLAGYTGEQAKHMLPYVLKLEELNARYPEKVRGIISEFDYELILVRARYYAGEMDRGEFKRRLIASYRKKNVDTFFIFSDYQLPNEYVGFLDRENLTEEDISNLEYVYGHLINDTFQLQNRDKIAAAAEYIAHMLDRFIEVPGGISLRDYSVNLLTAVWPQVYVHARSVAGLARCLCGHLIYMRPELFIGACGCRSADEVSRREEELCAFIYNAALIHDIGMIPLLPILNPVERPVFEEDELLIGRQHILGSRMASHAVSTAAYARVILQQGRRYDDPGVGEEEKVLADVLTMANDMDEFMQQMEAQGKEAKLEDFEELLAVYSGTAYAPYVEKLLVEPQVRADLEYLFGSGRENIYRQTYVMLKEVQDRGHL